MRLYLEYLVGLAFDFHTVDGGRCAGRQQLTRRSVLDQANKAGRGGIVSFKKTERGDFDTQLLGRIENRRAPSYGHGAIVDRECELSASHLDTWLYFSERPGRLRGASPIRFLSPATC